MAKMRARLGPASRAVVQCGARWTSRDVGTTPLTAPASGVGRFAGVIGLTAPAPAMPNAVTSEMHTTTTARRAGDRCTTRIQAGMRRGRRSSRTIGADAGSADGSEELGDIERTPVFGPESVR